MPNSSLTVPVDDLRAVLTPDAAEPREDDGRPFLSPSTPFAIVRMDLLRPTGTRTYCAYKGEAAYWSLDLGDRTLDDLVWTYESPLADAAAVVGLVAFFNERVDIVVDGAAEGRPATEFTATGWQDGTRR